MENPFCSDDDISHFEIKNTLLLDFKFFLLLFCQDWISFFLKILNTTAVQIAGRRYGG